MIKQVMLGAGVLLAFAGAPVASVHATQDETYEVTLCHATDSATNPYVRITVSVDAAGNFKDHGNGDHAHHTGPIATSEAVAADLKKQHIQWGDIIPAGDHNTSLNWTSEGQAIFNNGCSYTSVPQEEAKAQLSAKLACVVLNGKAYNEIKVTNSGNADGTIAVDGQTVTVAAGNTYVNDVALGDKLTVVVGNVTYVVEGDNCTPGTGSTTPQTPPQGQPVTTTSVSQTQPGQLPDTSNGLNTIALTASVMTVLTAGLGLAVKAFYRFI